MNVKVTREAAVLLLVFGIIMFANPSLWWLIFPVGAMITNSMRSQSGEPSRNQARRERRMSEEERRAERRAQRPAVPARSVGEEMRRQRQSPPSPGRAAPAYNNPTLTSRAAPVSRSAAPAAAKRDSAPLSHAVEAVEAAGHSPQDLALLPVDIGFITYKGADRPVVHREAPIPDTVDFIQPYVELYLERAAAGTLRFEIVDSAGEVHYVREERRQLKAGRSPVIPSTRMPVGDFLYTDTGWSLKVYAANTLIAEHQFGWVDPDSGTALREHLAEDGELSADLEMLVEDARLQPMSLDELLSSDEAVPVPAQAQSQAQARR